MLIALAVRQQLLVMHAADNDRGRDVQALCKVRDLVDAKTSQSTIVGRWDQRPYRESIRFLLQLLALGIGRTIFGG